MVEPTWPAPMTKIFTARRRVHLAAGGDADGRPVPLAACVVSPLRRVLRRRLVEPAPRVGDERRPRWARGRRPGPLELRCRSTGARGARPALRRRAGRARTGRGGARQARAPFLDVRSHVVAGGEQGLLGLAFAPRLRHEQDVRRQLHGARDGNTRVVRYRVRTAGRAAGERAAAPSRRAALREPQRRQRRVRPGRLALGRARRRRLGRRPGEPRAESRQSLLGKMLRLDVAQARRDAGARRRSASATRGASPSTARPATSGSATSVRARSRRSTALPRGTTGLRQLRLERLRGASAVQRPRRSGRDGWSSPSPSTRHAHGCSITGGYVYRGTAVPRLAGRYVFGDYCSGTIWSIPAGGGAVRTEPVRVQGLTSFGESLNGQELYAVSGSGTVYRFAR